MTFRNESNGHWRVKELIRGKDECVRVVRLKTSNGNNILRPVQKWKYMKSKKRNT